MSINLFITSVSCCFIQAAGPQAEFSHSRPSRVIPRGGLAAAVVGEDQCRLSNTDLAECATVDADNSDMHAVCITGHLNVQNCLLALFSNIYQLACSSLD